MLGIVNNYRVGSNIVKTSNTTLITLGLSVAIAASQKLHLRYWVPFTEGAGTAGIKFLLALSQTASAFALSFLIWNLHAAPGAIDELGLQTSSGSNFTGTGANSGNYLALIEADILNSTVAGTVDLQFAQQVSDAGATTVLAGSYLTTTIL
jgi:hypothetical protein